MRQGDANLAKMILSRNGLRCDVVPLENHGFVLESRQSKKNVKFELRIKGSYGNRAKIKVMTETGCVTRVSVVRIVDIKQIRNVLFGKVKHN